MTSFKVVAELASSDHARQWASGIAELIDPPPAGITLFECPAGWRIEVYYDEEPDCDALRTALADLLPHTEATLSLEQVPDENWVEMSQAGLPPVIAGRFTVHGSHDRHRVPQGSNAILIDAGEAFGTAHHATTYGCLLAISEQASRTKSEHALDLGCGSGVLAIAIARAFPKAHVLATDIDADSVRVATTNARLNRAAHRITFAEMSGPPDSGYGFDLVVANILAGPLIVMAPAITRAIAPLGTLILSGILVPQAAAVTARYRSLGFSLQNHRRFAGWSTLTLTRRPPRPVD